MARDAFERSRPSTIDELVEARNYAQAAALLRAEMQTHPPTLAQRLKLADLLVLADRGAAAVPILLAVANDLARYGMTERALEALRRADAITPGHDDIKRCFEAMARTARAKQAAAQALARNFDARTRPLMKVPAAGARPTDTAAKGPLEVDRGLLAFVRELGRGPAEGRAGLAALLFADLPEYSFRRVQSRLHRRHCPAGAVVMSEGDPGDSVFLLAKGSVRVLVIGGHGRALQIRRLDAPDFFGEVAVLHGRPRSATVVAVNDCELLEIEPTALESLLEARPEARAVLTDASEDRVYSAEEKAVRALPDDTSPEEANVLLAAHFGGMAWSPQVRLQLAKSMLDAGMEHDALTVIASVAEELSEAGNAEAAIEILKRVDQARRHRKHPSKRQSPAVTEAAFRTWLGSVAKEMEDLSARGRASLAEGRGAVGKRRG